MFFLISQFNAAILLRFNQPERKNSLISYIFKISLTNIVNLFDMKKIFLLLIILNFSQKNLFAQTQSKETIIIETKFGNIKLKLFEETPLHKANFIKLVKQKFSKFTKRLCQYKILYLNVY